MIPITVSHPEIAAQYADTARDVGTLSSGSRYRAVWRCDKGHEWPATVTNRIFLGIGCPFCSGRYATPGVNDIATTHPLIAAELYDEDASLIKSGSSKDVKWLCSKKHVWVASPYYRTTAGRECYFCSGKKLLTGFNDLATTHPELAAELVDDPTLIMANNRTPKDWLCPKGHVWSSPVHQRIRRGSTCLYCSGRKPIIGETDLVTLFPRIAKEFSPKNDFSILELTAGSTKMVLWVCSKGHEWPSTIANRTKRGSNCPSCSNRKIVSGENDLATTHPHLVAEWDDDEISPTEVPAGSGKKVGWKCDKGHKWKTWVYARTSVNPHGCPQCTSSQGERELTSWLESLGLNLVNRSRTIIKPYELDIYLPDLKIAIEFNGVYWHSSAAGKDSSYHVRKLDMCNTLGIRLIQVWEDDWLFNQEKVKRLILSRLGLSDGRLVGARKTKPTVITSDEASTFLELNHIQGKAAGSHYFGLIFEDELVAALVFTRQAKNSTVYILDRYATSVRLPGGFSKLLKFGLASIPGITKVVTFADLEISQGDLYEKTGFVVEKILPPDYKYVVGGRRVHKFNYRKSRIKSDPLLSYVESLTEAELMTLNGIPKVWDSGKIRYALVL